MKRYGIAILLGVATALVAGAEPLRLVAESERSGTLALIWPEHVRGQGRAVEAYVSLINALPEEVEVAVVGRRPPGERAMRTVHRPLRYVPAGRVDDLDIGVWGAWSAANPAGVLTGVVTEALPGARAQNQHHTAIEVAQALYGGHATLTSIRLRRGTLLHNGLGVALISQRVIADHASLAIQEIEEQLRDAWGLHKVVWVPVLPDEADGLFNGWLTFVGEAVVLLADFSDAEPERQAFARRLATQLRRDLGRGYQVLPVPAAYADVLLLRGRLVVPMQGTAEDERVQRLLKRALPDVEIWPLPAGVPAERSLQRVAVYY